MGTVLLTAGKVLLGILLACAGGLLVAYPLCRMARCDSLDDNPMGDESGALPEEHRHGH